MKSWLWDQPLILHKQVSPNGKKSFSLYSLKQWENLIKRKIIKLVLICISENTQFCNCANFLLLTTAENQQ